MYKKFDIGYYLGSEYSQKRDDDYIFDKNDPENINLYLNKAKAIPVPKKEMISVMGERDVLNNTYRQNRWINFGYHSSGYRDFARSKHSKYLIVRNPTPKISANISCVTFSCSRRSFTCLTNSYNAIYCTFLTKKHIFFNIKYKKGFLLH